MQVLALISQKGGSGKSTLARSLAVAAAYEETPVAIIDADPQGTLRKWSGRRDAPAPSVLTLGDDSLDALLKQAQKRGAALAVIDTPPHLRTRIAAVAKASHAAVVPVRPSVDDLEAVADTVALLGGLPLKVGIVLNLAPSRSNAQGTVFARQALATFQLPICGVEIVDRVAHQYAAAQGQTAQEFDSAGKASKEIQDVWAWVKSRLLL